jgi:DNA-binding CsgD family transcriptional regulator
VSQDALALCAAWNLGAERARNYTPQAVFFVPEEILAACHELKAQWPLDNVVTETSLPTRQVVGAQSGYEALVSFRREKGSTLTKPVFVIRLRPGENAALTEKNPLADAEMPSRLLHQLTPGERDLVGLVCAGLTNKEIAVQLRKTEGSVKVQLSGVFAKLRVHSRTQLVVALR